MKQKIINLLIEMLTPVVRALVRVAIEEVKGELVPELNTVNNVVINNVDSVIARATKLSNDFLSLLHIRFP